MKIYSLLFLLILIGSVSAVTLGENKIIGVDLEIPTLPGFDNNTGQVNDTTYWQGYTPATFVTYIQGLFDSVYCKLTGCTIAGSLIVNENITADTYFGDWDGGNVDGEAFFNSTGYASTSNLVIGDQNHKISQNSDTLTLYPNRITADPFKIRTHEDGANFITELVIDQLGDFNFQSNNLETKGDILTENLVATGNISVSGNITADTYFGDWDGGNVDENVAMKKNVTVSQEGIFRANGDSVFGENTVYDSKFFMNIERAFYSGTGRGISLTPRFFAINETVSGDSLAGLAQIGGGNYSSTAEVKGLFYGTFATLQQTTNPGRNLSVFGADIFGTGSFNSKVNFSSITALRLLSINPNGFGGKFTTNELIGLDIGNQGLPFAMTLDAVNATQLKIAKEDRADNNYQVVLEGTGDGTGVWFGGREEMRIYNDGTNLNFITNSTSNPTGNAWFSRNVSATGFITRTSVLSSEIIAKDWIKDTEDYKNVDGSVNHSAFLGHTEITVTDFSRPEIGIVQEEVCEMVLKKGVSEDDINSLYDYEQNSEEICSLQDVERTIYPYTKIEEGVDLQTEQNVLRQRIYEQDIIIQDLLTRVEALENPIGATK